MSPEGTSLNSRLPGPHLKGLLDGRIGLVGLQFHLGERRQIFVHSSCPAWEPLQGFAFIPFIAFVFDRAQADILVLPPVGTWNDKSRRSSCMPRRLWDLPHPRGPREDQRVNQQALWQVLQQVLQTLPQAPSSAVGRERRMSDVVTRVIAAYERIKYGRIDSYFLCECKVTCFPQVLLET